MLAPTVEHRSETRRDGSTTTILLDTRTGRAARLEQREWDLLVTGGTGLGHDATEALLADLGEQGLLAGTAAQSDAQLSDGDNPGRLAMFLRTLDLPWRGADGVVRSLYNRGLRRAFHPAAVVVQIILALVGALAVWKVATTGSVQWRAEPWMVPAVLAVNFFAIACHELGHAVILVHHGRTVRAAGFRFHLGTPAFYIDSIDALLLPRRQRLIQAAAGPWAEWLVTAAVALLVIALPEGPLMEVGRRFVVLNLIVIASNLLPFVGLDGYWLLADIIREPQPAERGREKLGRTFDDIRNLERPSLAGLGWCVYGLANSLVATVLLLTAGVFWYQTFGHTVGAVMATGPIGVLAVAVLAAVLVRPAILAARPASTRLCRHAGELGERLRFRTQRRWRTRAITALLEQGELQQLDDIALGVLAGRLVPIGRHVVFDGLTSTVGGRTIGLLRADLQWVIDRSAGATRCPANNGLVGTVAR